MALRKSGTDQLFGLHSEKAAADNSSRTENSTSGEGVLLANDSKPALAGKVAGFHRQDYPVDVLSIRVIDSSHCCLACLIWTQEGMVREMEIQMTGNILKSYLVSHKEKDAIWSYGRAADSAPFSLEK